jgi:leader peptidase (prepilin peptidase)/N-methyltransferase
MKLYQIIVTGVFLGVCTYTDLKYRFVYWKIVVIAVGLIFSGYFAGWVFAQKTAIEESAGTNDRIEILTECGSLLLSVIPGVGCLLVSFLTGEALGYGDGIVVMVCGLSMGFADTVEWLLLGFFLSALWAVYLCVFRKAGRKKEFPFLPFLMGAFVIKILFLTSG